MAQKSYHFNDRMDTVAFSRLAEASRIKGVTYMAARLVLIDGKTAYQAAKETGVAQSTVSRALRRMYRPVCTCCGQPTK